MYAAPQQRTVPRALCCPLTEYRHPSSVQSGLGSDGTVDPETHLCGIHNRDTLKDLHPVQQLRDEDEELLMRGMPAEPASQMHCGKPVRHLPWDC